MEKEKRKSKPNRLAHETSPYLLQHAHNPVDWYPWGEEALKRAKAENRPILLSIGYSSCHWCHVMEHESFEDDAIAAVMNKHFVCIKVDREERPDLDDIYMKATQAMNQGQGGWPMTVFLTPDQKPFFAGTYFPPEDRYGRPGFGTLLNHISELWSARHGELVEQADKISEFLQESGRGSAAMTVGESELRAFVEQLWNGFDDRYGGFGGAPKFPPSGDLLMLLRCHRRFGDARALEMATKTLDAMARGGMYDQVGGGFHRYSVDATWLVPHFEKMLYDNAQLASVYLEAFQATKNVFYARIAAEILDYVLREMTSPEGGFYSATDADSEGEEGRFFVWTRAEIESILGVEEARKFCAYYDISDRGNWEGKNIPNIPKSLEDVAGMLNAAASDLERSLAASRAKIYEARKKRVPPGMDDKILAAWNGLMIAAFAEGYRVLGDRRYLDAACKSADFILKTLRGPDGGLLRTFRAGKAHLNAYLEDYAYFADALITLYEAGGPARYLQEATHLADRILSEFSDPHGGGFYATSKTHERLIFRPRDGHDSATPSDNALACSTLARLSFHLSREDYRDAASGALRGYGRTMASSPRSFARSLAVVDFLLAGPVELAFVGSPEDKRYTALQQAVSAVYVPNRIIAHHDPADGPVDFPLVKDKQAMNGKPALYVCRNFACRSPVTEPSEVEAALGEGVRTQETGRTSIGKRLSGAATAESTRAYAGRFVSSALPHGYGPLGSTGLTVSRLGFGCYRVSDESEAHSAALERALLSGCNLVDTSTNYADGASERAVGQVVTELVNSGRIARESVVLVSKIGYVQGSNLDLAMQREGAGEPFPEMVKYAEGIWHCMHRDFLEDQLTRSLDRLDVETLDVCLIHNPEYFLSEKKNTSREPLEEVRTEFYRRIREAFRWLESQVAAGRIRWYGVSSNTSVLLANDPDSTSLTRFLSASVEAGGKDHHFRVIQLPMNLLESGAALERNCGVMQPQTVLECAAQNGVAVLVNRPLNALAGDTMIRLAEPHVEAGGANFTEQLDRVARLEAEYRRDIAPFLKTAIQGAKPEAFFRWADDMAALKNQPPNLEQWTQIEQFAIMPQLVAILQAVDRSFTSAPNQTWQKWRDRYLEEFQRLLAAFRRSAAEKSRDDARAVCRVIDPLLPSERASQKLSRKAMWILASAPGVSCVLNGMRRNDYVDDALAVLGWPPLTDAIRVFERVKEDPPVGRRVSLIVP